MASYLITGAGRGLGLELATQLHKLPQVCVVFAATRSSPSNALQRLIDGSAGKVVHILVEITDKSSVNAAVAQAESRLFSKGLVGLDVLINNAGILPQTLGGIAAMDNLREAFEVNVEAVHITTAAFLPLLQKGGQKKVVNV